MSQYWLGAILSSASQSIKLTVKELLAFPWTRETVIRKICQQTILFFLALILVCSAENKNGWWYFHWMIYTFLQQTHYNILHAAVIINQLLEELHTNCVYLLYYKYFFVHFYSISDLHTLVQWLTRALLQKTQNEREMSVKRNFFIKATKKTFIECNQFLFVNVWKRKSGALMDLLMESIEIHVAWAEWNNDNLCNSTKSVLSYCCYAHLSAGSLVIWSHLRFFFWIW